MSPNVKMTAALIAATLLLLPYPEQVAAAKADYIAYGPSARYLDVSAWTDDQQADALDAWRFQWPHLTRSLSLAHKFVRLKRTNLIRVDIDAIGWGRKGWSESLKGYPYSDIHDKNQPQDLLIARLDWLMRAASDSTFLAGGKPSEAYFRLLFSGENPKTKGEFLKLLGVTEKRTGREQGLIIKAGESGVAHHRRLIAYHPDEGADWFETFDSKTGSGDQDPTFGPGQFKFDAQEIIVPIEGALPFAPYSRVRRQAYALTDGAEKIVAVADTDVVDDKLHTLNRVAVKTMVTCVNCHGAGLNGNNSNYYIEYRQLPGHPYIKFQTPEITEQFNGEYLGSFGKTVRRANEDVAEFCLDFVGREPKDAVRNWIRTLALYDEPLSLEQAARERYCDPETLSNALSYLSGIQKPESKERYFDASILANGGEVSRNAWEDAVYHQSGEALAAWRAKQ